jgi:hypothetical protein
VTRATARRADSRHSSGATCGSLYIGRTWLLFAWCVWAGLLEIICGECFFAACRWGVEQQCSSAEDMLPNRNRTFTLQLSVDRAQYVRLYHVRDLFALDVCRAA